MYNRQIIDHIGRSQIILVDHGLYSLITTHDIWLHKHHVYDMIQSNVKNLKQKNAFMIAKTQQEYILGDFEPISKRF